MEKHMRKQIPATQGYVNLINGYQVIRYEFKCTPRYGIVRQQSITLRNMKPSSPANAVGNREIKLLKRQNSLMTWGTNP